MTTFPTRVETHSHASAVHLITGHPTECELSDTDQPSESAQVVLDGRKSYSQCRENTPKSNLCFHVLLVWFDNKPLCPSRRIPFFGSLWFVVFVDSV